MKFERSFFEDILKSEQVAALCEARADAAAEIARANAPVKTGAYRDSIHVERHIIGDRVSALVVADDYKTIWIEALTGNLARAIRAVK